MIEKKSKIQLSRDMLSSIGSQCSLKKPEGLILLIHVQPGARNTEIVGLYGEPPRLKIKLKAPPVEGKANQELIRFLSDLLGVAKNSIEILRGDKSSRKDLCIRRGDKTLEELIKDQKSSS